MIIVCREVYRHLHNTYLERHSDQPGKVKQDKVIIRDDYNAHQVWTSNEIVPVDHITS